VVVFGFCTGSKGEKSNFLNSLLVPALNPKTTAFLPLVPVQSDQEIEETN
jgi:hypothetical protein